MSLEESVKSLTEAIERLTTTLADRKKAELQPSPEREVKTPAETKTEKPAPKKSGKKKPEPVPDLDLDMAAPTPATEDTQNETEKTETPETTSEYASYTADRIRRAILPIAQTHGSKLVADIIRGLGYTKLSDLPPEKYGDLVKAVEQQTKETVKL